MKYMGGKERVSKKVVAFLEGIRGNGQTYLEPFCGSLAIGSKMTGKRIASDAFEVIISYHKGLQNGWLPPQIITHEDWKAVKAKMDLSDPMTGHCGFNVSFGGNWFVSYSKAVPTNDYVQEAYNTSKRLASKIKGIELMCCSYDHHQPENCLIYCDPPYANTVDYSKQLKEKFDHDCFWQTMRDWSKKNTVVISEYAAPNDFVCVASFDSFVTIQCHSGKSAYDTGTKKERLFMHRSNVKLPFLNKAGRF